LLITGFRTQAAKINAVSEGDVRAFTEKTVTFENTDYITFGNRGFIGLEGYKYIYDPLECDQHPNEFVYFYA
jgi:hypothetical protein